MPPLPTMKSTFAGGKKYALVIRTDDVVYGPFASEKEAEGYAIIHYEGDQAALEHADTNADFYTCELKAPQKKAT